MKGSTPQKNQDHIPCSLAYKLLCVDDKFARPIVVFRGEYAAYDFIEKSHKQHMNTVKK